MLKQFCREKQVTLREVGTVVIAKKDEELEVLRELKQRAEENGVKGVRILDRQELKAIEPFADGRSALLSPSGAIVDSYDLVNRVAQDGESHGVRYAFGARVVRADEEKDFVRVETEGSEFHAEFLLNCAGLYADRIAHMMNLGHDYCVIPFRGDYYRLTDERSFLVKSMIYPTPNLRLPFLGIHLTRRTNDSVIVGPNASLAFGREKYRDAPVDWSEAIRMLLDVRFAKLMSDKDFVKLAYRELRLTLNKKEFTNTAKKLVPQISERDLIPDQSGIRAQLVNRKGQLVDDFVFEQSERSFHVLNAVSPGMTSALAFAQEVDRLISEYRP